jgi:hypothetical protein
VTTERCRRYMRLYMRTYRQVKAHRDKERERARLAWKENRNGIRDRKREYKRLWLKANREKVREYSRRWYKAHREEVLGGMHRRRLALSKVHRGGVLIKRRSTPVPLNLLAETAVAVNASVHRQVPPRPVSVER